MRLAAGRRRTVSLLCAGWMAVSTLGCLGEPEIEDQWTRLDILDVEPIGTEGRLPAGETIDLRQHVLGVDCFER